MKRKLISALTAALLIQTLIFGQSATYNVELAKFSSRKFDEFSPVYYKNGLVFCSNRNESFLFNYLTSENKGLLKIVYVDTAKQDSRRSVRLFSKDLKTTFNDGPASFSKNGDTIYFSRNLKVIGKIRENSNLRNKLGVFIAVRDGRKWTRTIDLRFNNEYYNITTPSISPDGKKLYFASDNPAGLGGSDIYYCQLKGDYWDDPVNLGPVVNTAGNESYPFASRDGGLFFSSDGHQGLGGKDIFYTKQVNGNWLPPVRLDEPINSRSDDFGLVADSVLGGGFFSSNRDGTSINIYHFRTNVHQIFYCDNERVNQYCFKFSDKDKIDLDDRYFQLVWTFGDGGKATGLTAEHCYSGAGRYGVKLDIVEKKSGKVFFTKLSYNIELKDIEQPVISAPASAMAGAPVTLDGLSSTFPGSQILNYTWDMGEGDRIEGDKISHEFTSKGDYIVKLGLIVRNDKTGVIQNACVTKPIKVFDNKQSKSEFDAIPVKPAPRINVFDYDHAYISDLFSAEKEYSKDMVFDVEILTSKTRLGPDNAAFKNIPSRYTLREIYFPDKKTYSYVVDEEISLMATYPSYNDISDVGFKNARIITYTLESPAARELNNLKRVFGLSADAFFKKNDFSLTSAGTQILDLILGFLSKYPALKIELSVHSDNQETPASNQLLTQKRAEAMVNYLNINGVNPLRLVAKGYGSTRPVAANSTEADRKLNRRVDFMIIKE
jgi:outer membrane protein OmpA-like peptidoglycan-associated protein